MGILNLTPDSFFEPSRYNMSILDSGADYIDIGAVSTRPGHTPVSFREEWNRLSPALEALEGRSNLSFDTTRSRIARRLLRRLDCKFIVNDVSAGEDDPAMIRFAAKKGLTYVAMHHSGFKAVSEVIDFFDAFGQKAARAGLEDWILDPGFGFDKNIDENMLLLENLDRFKAFGKPVLVGISRKRMTGGSAEKTEELHRVALEKGADILRVHDVEAARKTIEDYCLSSSIK